MRLVVTFALAALLVAPLHLATLSPSAGEDKPEVDASNPFVEVTARDERPSTTSTEGIETDGVSSSIWETRQVRSSCSSAGSQMFCQYYACASPDQVGYIVERRLRGSDDEWIPFSRACVGPDGPVVTPGLVLEEVRRIGLPAMSVEVPPETLVNYDTVVYTEAETFSRTVTLLGFTVDLEATPSQFHWTYGDSTTETTTTAGRPHPATDITHTWDDAHRTFHPSVDVTYEIRFRVDGGEWQSLTDTITTDGPEGDVRIREATGMLADMR